MTDRVNGTIGVVGAGKVGAGIGVGLGKAGYKVVYLSRTPDSEKMRDLCIQSGRTASAADLAAGAAMADILFFAVPWAAARDTIDAMGDLEGKILLDATNPVIFKDGRDENAQVATSAAEMIQSWAAGAAVVKAFNTLNAKVIADPGRSGGPVTIPIAGDDPDAKAKARILIEALGFEAFDVGALANARGLESMAKLLIDVLMQNRPDAFDFYLRPRPK